MKRCLVLHFWGDVDTNPTLMGLMRHLIAAGFHIDLICETRDFFLPPSLEPEHVSMHPVHSWRNCAHQLQKDWSLKLRGEKYSFVIAVDPQGLYAARHLIEYLSVPLVYLSFEILFQDELEKDEELHLKTVEIELSRRAAFIIIQDEERGELLASENGLADHHFLYLPNAPSDVDYSGDGSYLRDRFNIPPSKKIVLHTGSFDFWTAGEELIAEAAAFPDEFILVVHSRQIPGKNDLVSRMEDVANPAKVYFSTAPLAFDDYTKLVDSCDIGLVLYKMSPTIFTQKNLFHIGLSSGKFAYFARHGKPVITSDLPSYRSIFNRSYNGVYTPKVSALGEILRKYATQFPQMGRNNRLFFCEQLDFSKNIVPIMERIKGICQ
jgi:glycosyltransferase involved in cell wall biosynthesis